MNERPIRILHVIGIMNRGGAETMVMNLYRNIDRNRVQFDFVENENEQPAAFDQEIQSLGGRIYHCPKFDGKNIIRYKRWWNDFFGEHSGEYKIVHGHIGSTAAIYLNAAKKHGMYTVAHSHGKNGVKSLRTTAYQLLSYRTRFIADFFFGCSAIAGEDRFGKKVVGSDRYRIFNNAIDVEKFKYDPDLRSAVREKLGVGEKEYVIGHVGRFDSAKNQSYLIEIYNEISKKRKDVKLMLVGDGAAREKVKLRAEELGLTERIMFLGIRSDVPELLQAMDIMVFPSKNEGLPVTLVEAQASGLACVISDGVPTDSIIARDLVTVCSLKDPPEIWADHVIRRLGEERRDHSCDVAEAGFDIKQTAKWIEEFYIEKYK